MRLQAQLINVSDDSHIWSQIYERELKSMFAVQDDISRAIVDAMKIELMGNETSSLKRRYTENVEAFEFYSRGRHLWNKRTESDLKKSIEYFEKAIELDSNYALAYSGLADAWTVIPFYLNVPGSVTSTEANARAKKAAEMAIELDESLAEAYASLGHILKNQSRYKESERNFLRSIDFTHVFKCVC